MITVMHYISIMNRGGQETYLMNLLRNIDRSKFKFIFLCLQNGKGDYDEEINQLGSEVCHLGNSYGHLKILKNKDRLKKYLMSVQEVDVFEIHTQSAMDAFFSAKAALDAGIKNVIVHSHNSYTTYHPKMHFLFRPLLNTLAIERVACSLSAGEWMFGKNRNFYTFYNSININKFSFCKETREKVRQTNNWKGKFIIGNVGRLNQQKNHKFLLEIFKDFNKKYPNSKLALIGRGELEEELMKYASNLGIKENVEFMGSRGDVDKLYSGMDAFVFPSLYEGLPVTLIEAQTNGLPCIVSNNVTKEVKITPYITFIDINDRSRWIEAIEKSQFIATNRSEGSRIVKQSFYNIDNEANRICEYYKKMTINKTTNRK